MTEHERIWLQSEETSADVGYEGRTWATNRIDEGCTEYVRADLFAALESALAEAERERERLKQEAAYLHRREDELRKAVRGEIECSPGSIAYDARTARLIREHSLHVYHWPEEAPTAWCAARSDGECDHESLGEAVRTAVAATREPAR